MLFLLFAISSHAADKASPAAPPPPLLEDKADLTPFLLNRFAEALRVQDWQARKQLLIRLRREASPAKGAPLRGYRASGDTAAKAALEAKADLVFHMLKRIAGDERFSAARKEFTALAKTQPVGWDDLRSVFEKQTTSDLATFFRQWVDGKGLPDLRIEKASAKRRGSGYETVFDVVQSGTPYELDLPVEVVLADGRIKKETIKVSGDRKNVVVTLDAEPRDMVVDAEYETPRKLSGPEYPPLIESVSTAEKLVVVPAPAKGETYRPVIEALKKRGAVEREAQDLKEADITSSTVVILGAENPVAARLYGTIEPSAAGLSLTARKNPWNDGLVAAIVQARSAAEAAAAFDAALEAGDSSSVAFDRGKVVSRRTDASERGMRVELRQETMAVDLSALRTLDDVIAAAADKRIVYVGEYHDKFSHHDVQVQAVRDLHRKWPKLAVGMEMFQQPFQQALDDYIAGTIDEREFLKRSEYFKRWGFDYNLYKPILDLCRAEKLPVVALNARREITDKVSKDGMDALTDKERAELPREMDFSDDVYRKRLKDIFEQHRSSPERTFDRFYQAQIVWDETMAQSVDDFLKSKPEYRMVVIAGGGHLAYGSGIPKRSFRRNGLPYSIILNDADIERGIADFAVYPQSLEGATAPRLMAMLKEEDGKVAITGFSPGSPAEKAGLREGDVLLSADGASVKDVGDLKLALYYKKSGDSIVVSVVRKRFLFGPREMTFEVKL